MMRMKVDCVIIGGGIVGSSVGIPPLRWQRVLKCLVLEERFIEYSGALQASLGGKEIGRYVNKRAHVCED
jgi:glycine/D-amino acid oxidase-like deaminating enzyme